MKKYLAFILAMVFVLASFAACGVNIESTINDTSEPENSLQASDVKTDEPTSDNTSEGEPSYTDESVTDENIDVTEDENTQSETALADKDTDFSTESNTQSGVNTDENTGSAIDTNTQSDSSSTDDVTEINTQKATESDTQKTPESDTQKETESDTQKETDSNRCTHDKLENGVCIGCGHQIYVREGDVILFGEYPQSLKADSVSIVGSTPDARGYYLGSDNAYYAKVTASPYDSEYSFSDGTLIKKANVYYFKVEPIKWRIISQDNDSALILCQSILINKAYDASSNSYMDSDVAKWLTKTFFESSFDDIQKEFVKTVSLESSNEKVFLISEAEAFSNTSTMKLQATDFARANGAWISTLAGKGNGIWWLRTSSAQSANKVKVVTHTGEASNYEIVTNAGFGVVPALRLPLK